MTRQSNSELFGRKQWKILEEIRKKVSEDEAFSSSLKEAQAPQEVFEVLLKAGFNVTLDEVKAMAKTGDGELSDDQLDAVSGGSIRPPIVEWPFW